VTIPVVWISEANQDLLEARAWYGKIRPALGGRFALAVEATVKVLAEHPLRSPSSTGIVRGPGCGASATEYSSRRKTIGLW
jgi:plasmid stabilization system protein ParE